MICNHYYHLVISSWYTYYKYILCTPNTPTEQAHWILLFSSLNVLKCAHSIILQCLTFNKYDVYKTPRGFKGTNFSGEVPSTGSTATALHILPCRTLFVVCLTFSFRPFRARKVSVASLHRIVRKRGGWVQEIPRIHKAMGCTHLCSQNQAIVCNVSGKKKTWGCWSPLSGWSGLCTLAN